MIYLRESFMRDDYSLKDVDICLLGIPFDSTSISHGSRFGPAAIREALKDIEGYDSKTGLDPFEKLRIVDLGDIEIVPGSYKLTAERITDTIEWIREQNPDVFVLSLGGEHLISLPVIETLKPETVVQFDAHADLREDFIGNEYSHATWAYHIAKGFNLIQKGVRSWSREEENALKELRDNKFSSPAYLTVDIDVFDPSIAPETGLPEPSGWSFDEFCKNLNSLKKENLIGADMVEVAPSGFNSPTAFLAANVIKRILCMIAKNKR